MKAMTYEECKAAFVAWCMKHDYEPKDPELWDAFFNGIVVAERRLGVAEEE